MDLKEHVGLSSRLDILGRFNDLPDPEELRDLVVLLRPRLRNVIATTIGKGGEGKTTTSINLAYVLAEREAARAESGKEPKPILYIELDGNGNGRHNSGIRHGVFDDDGQGFFHAVIDDKPLKVVEGVRPFLDVTVGGSRNSDIPTAVARLSVAHGQAAYLLLALLLAQISHKYRWILLDFSPGDKMLQRLGLAACTHLVAPLKGSDNAVVEGLGTLARYVRENRSINPEVAIAAIVFLGYRRVLDKPTSQLLNLREKISILLEQAKLSDEILIDSYIREGRLTADLSRNYGLLAGEFALATTGELRDRETGKLVEHPRDENGRLADAERAIGIATDYRDVGTEIIDRVRRRNKALREGGQTA